MKRDYENEYIALAGRRLGRTPFHPPGVAIGLGYAGLSALDRYY
jgi:hypothetical protein